MLTFDPVTYLAFGITMILLAVIVGVRELRLRHAAVPTPSRRELAAQAEAADHIRGLRIVADDGDFAMWTTGTYPAVGGSAATFDARTAELVVDPTLRRRDLAGVVEHVEDGPGSVRTIATTAEDTRLRSPMMQAQVEAAEAEAYAMAEAEDIRIMVDAALGQSSAWSEQLDRKLWAIAPWVFYAHDDERAECAHCAHALSTVSNEYRLMTEHTGEISRRELEALLAAA